MNESTITVITPFHNTEHELFLSAVSSMEEQTLSPDRIEWIIVVHNSDDSYLQFVREKTAHLSFVTVYELHNDKSTASSPRNYALEHIHGTYITFLDSDDMLTPECLAVIVAGMDETGADLGKYRGERKQEDENISSFLDNRVRFSQTKSLLCFQKNDPELNKLFTMANMMMNCQVIRTSFLMEHQIRFREDIRIEEDVVFNLECLRYASSVAVFPQMIGYIYYMHHGSTMQETLSVEKLLKTCHDLAKQLELGLSFGFDMRYLFMGHMKMIAEEIGKAEWDIAVRREIRDCFLPFYQKIALPDANEKFLSAEELKRIFAENERVVLGYDLFDDGAGALRRILKNNSETELGKEWDFETIKTTDEYRRRVPVTNYDVYSPYIELTTRIGESDIFCGEEITGYALSSGTSGRRKKIPYISEQITENAEELRRLLAGAGSSFLLMQSIRSEEKNADGTYLDSITGAVLQALESDLRYESFRLSDCDGAVTSPKRLFFSANGISSYYEKLLYALLDKRVQRIIAPFTWYLLDIFQYLERHYERLLNDMREGNTIKGVPHKERADELEKIFSEGFDTPILPRIWPDLKLVVAGGSGTFNIYTDRLKRYTGNILHHERMYAASEGIFARYDEKTSKFRMKNDRFFFEFREISDDGTEGETVLLEQVKDGGKYEVIVSNASGLYRYALGDVILADHREGSELLFDLLYRRSNELCLAKGAGVITPDAIDETVSELITGKNLPAGDYCYGLSEDEDCLELYLEQAGYGEEQLTAFDVKSIASDFDNRLRIRSTIYDAARNGSFNACRVFYLEAETQAAFRETCVMRSHLTPDQMKPVRLLDNPVKRKFFTTFVTG